jgi:hypothetical protein
MLRRRRRFSKYGNDIVYGELSNHIYVGKNYNLLNGGAGKVYVDGATRVYILTVGFGNALLAGGNGNNKLLARPSTSEMYGGKVANNFDCPLSALGLARNVVMDYNPSNGDALSGTCKIINTVGNSNSENSIDVLSVTGDSGGGSIPINLAALD